MGFTTKLLDILSINATAAKDYIDKLLETKQNKLTFDDAPKKGSTNPVTSDGIRKAIDTATPNVDFSNYPTKNGTGAIGTWPISISGTATKASQDSNGDVIADEYWHNAFFLYDCDLNAVRKQGVYKQNLNAQSTAEHHYPVNHAGALLVVESTVNGVGACTQIYYPYNNNQAFQRKYDVSTKVWSNWREYLFTDSSVTNATKASQDSNGNVIADTYLKKAGDTATGDITAPNFIGNLKGNADNATRAAAADTLVGSTTVLKNDIDTVNNSDTWIPVISNGKIQHTEKLNMKVGAAVNADAATKATMVNATAPNGGAADLAFGTMALNDYGRIRVGGKNDNGWLEIATADGGNEPIYARQYSGAYDWPNGRPGTVKNEAVLLDGNGNTKFPKNVTAASFTGTLKGNADSATEATKVYGIYTANGGQQGPSFFGKNSAGCLMSNQPINGHDEYKNWLYMDNYDGSDVGGATAIGVSRTETRAYIMSSNADRKQWNRTAELLSSANYNSYAPTKTGSGASGTWGINITGNAATATTTDNAKKLGGYALNTESTGGHFGTIPKVGTDGVMEVGKYIDWHSQNGGSADYTSRWEAQNNGTVTVGTINGTLNGNAATATKALNVPTSDVGGNIWIA